MQVIYLYEAELQEQYNSAFQLVSGLDISGAAS